MSSQRVSIFLLFGRLKLVVQVAEVVGIRSRLWRLQAALSYGHLPLILPLHRAFVPILHPD